MHIAFLVDFALFEYMRYVPSDNRLVALEQLNHLSLRQPDGLVLQTNVQPDCFIRLVNNYLVISCHILYATLSQTRRIRLLTARPRG